VGFTTAIETETTIIVNTAPNFTVNAFFTEANSGAYSVIEMMNENSTSDGKAIFVLVTSKPEFELKLNLKKDGETHYSDDFDGESFPTGETIELDFYPKWYPKPQPKTENQTTESNETETISEETVLNETVDEVIQQNLEDNSEIENNSEVKNSKEKVTALSISDGTISINGKTLAYAGGIIVLALILFLFIRWEMKKPKREKTIKVTKLSEIQQQKQEDTNDIKTQEEKINQAKKMIKDAEEQINKLKNPNMTKIEEAKRKLIEDEKELIRLRRESLNK
jgi:hypothetical protein